MEGVVIREARREDCSDILRLVKELANFENIPDGPNLKVQELEQDGFNAQHPYFRCFIAELLPNTKVLPTLGNESAVSGQKSVNTEIVGYALYYFTYSTWNGPALHLEDLYVTEGCRSQGIGSALFDRVAKEAFDLGCCRLDFTVLKWNPATEFYKHKGAVDLTATEGWHQYRLERDALEQLATKSKRTNIS